MSILHRRVSTLGGYARLGVVKRLISELFDTPPSDVDFPRISIPLLRPIGLPAAPSPTRAFQTGLYMPMSRKGTRIHPYHFDYSQSFASRGCFHFSPLNISTDRRFQMRHSVFTIESPGCPPPFGFFPVMMSTRRTYMRPMRRPPMRRDSLYTPGAQRFD